MMSIWIALASRRRYLKILVPTQFLTENGIERAMSYLRKISATVDLTVIDVKRHFLHNLGWSLVKHSFNKLQYSYKNRIYTFQGFSRTFWENFRKEIFILFNKIVVTCMQKNFIRRVDFEQELHKTSVFVKVMIVDLFYSSNQGSYVYRYFTGSISEFV